MNKKTTLGVSVCLLISVAVIELTLTRTQAQSDKLSTGVTLSPTEEELFAEINQARAHPDVYAKYLAGLKPFFNNREYKPQGRSAVLTNEGWVAVEEAISFLSAAKPQRPFSLSRGLSSAAALHLKDQSTSGSTGHKSPNNSYLEARTSTFGMYQGAVGENLSYGNQSARERVLTWLIDDGFATRGHRRRLLSADYGVAGVSCGSHPEYGAMCVLTLAESFTDFPLKAAEASPAQPTKADSRGQSTNAERNTRKRKVDSRPRP
jgi:uncharacterized protein YkwD